MAKSKFVTLFAGCVVLLISNSASAEICNRSMIIQSAIATALGNADCRQVTDADLASITSLQIDPRVSADQPLKELYSYDLKGLTALKELYLSDLGSEYTDSRPIVYSLPLGIFDDLVSLEKLSLDNTALDVLPGGIFRGLTKLKTLWLFSNLNLKALPSDIFQGLSSLETLNLLNNESMGAVPTFSGLTSLKQLDLSYCSISTLPKQVFVDLQNLEVLYFRQNPLAVISKADTGLSSTATVWGATVVP